MKSNDLPSVYFQAAGGKNLGEGAHRVAVILLHSLRAIGQFGPRH